MRFFLALLISLGCFHSFGQKVISWDDLDCEFVEEWSEEFQAMYMYPVFPEDVKELDGEFVEVEGVLTIVDVESGYYIVGKGPVGFGCGMEPSGSTRDPREMIQVTFLKLPEDFKNGKKIKVQGTLRLNADDILSLVYILEEPVIIE
jgi:hypothetical protein